jgi:hypothetical protein
MGTQQSTGRIPGPHNAQVDQEGTMLNIFVDGEGQPQYVPVGNISELGSVDAAALGGVPIGDLEKAHEKQVRQLRQATC